MTDICMWRAAVIQRHRDPMLLADGTECFLANLPHITPPMSHDR